MYKWQKVEAKVRHHPTPTLMEMEALEEVEFLAT